MKQKLIQYIWVAEILFGFGLLAFLVLALVLCGPSGIRFWPGYLLFAAAAIGFVIDGWRGRKLPGGGGLGWKFELFLGIILFERVVEHIVDIALYPPPHPEPISILATGSVGLCLLTAALRGGRAARQARENTGEEK